MAGTGRNFSGIMQAPGVRGLSPLTPEARFGRAQLFSLLGYVKVQDWVMGFHHSGTPVALSM